MFARPYRRGGGGGVLHGGSRPALDGGRAHPRREPRHRREPRCGHRPLPPPAGGTGGGGGGGAAGHRTSAGACPSTSCQSWSASSEGSEAVKTVQFLDLGPTRMVTDSDDFSVGGRTRTIFLRLSGDDLAITGLNLSSSPIRSIYMTSKPTDVQPEPPLVQPETMSSYPVAGCLGEKADSYLVTASFQYVLSTLLLEKYKIKRKTNRPQLSCAGKPVATPASYLN
ncbi:uncharacterized protein LOC127469156 isoform X2 [Manacus candei]|uniref:uncharacterized protein LOC127469156 isoform X2 n=1 Tax=Manacus candei TaxID=415023 RepID=UPI0022261DD9|nr:uncharacterized protein LOC127469156 isoform X2 [Manacus candei]